MKSLNLNSPNVFKKTERKKIEIKSLKKYEELYLQEEMGWRSAAGLRAEGVKELFVVSIVQG